MSDAEEPGGDVPAMRAVETSSTLNMHSRWAVPGYHLRAARTMLGWPMEKLADTSKLSVSTLRRLEDTTTEISQRSRFKAVVALHAAGIRFILADGSVIGVTLFHDLNAIPLNSFEITGRRAHRYVLARSNEDVDASRSSPPRNAQDRC